MTEPTRPETQVPAGETPRWRGHTHRELYLMLHDGPGAAASAEPSRRWQEIAASLDEIGQDLSKALEQAGAGWAGKAGGRAHEQLSATATWATETSTAAAEMRTAVEDQGDHLAKARADMPPPEDVEATEPDPTVAPAMRVARTQDDLEANEAAASSAEERAFEVMAAYAANTETTTAAMAVFPAPPELVRRDGMHHGGGIGQHGTRPAGLLGLGEPPPGHEHRRPLWQGLLGGDRWQPSTTGSSAPVVEPPAPRAPAPPAPPAPAAPAKPGGFSGAVLTPPPGTEQRPRPSTRSGTPTSAPGGSSGAVPPRVGLGSPDLPAAAPPAAPQHTGTPVAPAVQQERMALRRLGVDAIGSSQWFGDTDEPVVGDGPRRRWELRESSTGVTEPVTILGEEHQLPL